MPTHLLTAARIGSLCLPCVVIAGCLLPGSLLPCLTFLTGYEVAGELLDADTSEPLPKATITIRLIPPNPFALQNVVLTDEAGKFKSSAPLGSDCDFLLEPTPLGDPPEEIELEIVTNTGTVIVNVNVEPEMVTALDETHGRIDLPPILVSAGE